jgi:hypothetical protein
MATEEAAITVEARSSHVPVAKTPLEPQPSFVEKVKAAYKESPLGNESGAVGGKGGIPKSEIRKGTASEAQEAVSKKRVTAPNEGTEIVQRAMSRAELKSVQNSGVLSRGGRRGPHYVSDAVNSNALRARQRLSLSRTPEVRVTMEVPQGIFSNPSKVSPKFGMFGGGMERTAPGNLNIPAKIIEVLEY